MPQGLTKPCAWKSFVFLNWTDSIGPLQVPPTNTQGGVEKNTKEKTEKNKKKENVLAQTEAVKQVIVQINGFGGGKNNKETKVSVGVSFKNKITLINKFR